MRLEELKKLKKDAMKKRKAPSLFIVDAQKKLKASGESQKKAPPPTLA